jgi:hypothetical protein
MRIDEIKTSIDNYKNYLNNGQFKPDWRVDEVETYIEVMEKIIEAQKGKEKNENIRTD